MSNISLSLFPSPLLCTNQFPFISDNLVNCYYAVLTCYVPLLLSEKTQFIVQ